MSDLNHDEKLKIAVGVWICFADGKPEASESTKLYQVMKRDLLPEHKEPAIKEITYWMLEFKKNHLATENSLKKMIQENERLPIIKNQLIDLCHHIKEADGITKMQEEAAITQLERWVTN